MTHPPAPTKLQYVESQLKIKNVKEGEPERERGAVVSVAGCPAENSLCVGGITLYIADHFQSKGHVWLSAHISNGHLLIQEDKGPGSPSHFPGFFSRRAE